MLRLFDSRSSAEASDKLSPRFHCSPLSNVTSGLDCLSVNFLVAIRSLRSHLSIPSADSRATPVPFTQSCQPFALTYCNRQGNLTVTLSILPSTPFAQLRSPVPRLVPLASNRAANMQSRLALRYCGVQDVKLREFDVFFGSVVELKLSESVPFSVIFRTGIAKH
ncbi:hypothetical protein BDW69DRAFT_86067 [Aspergillus filifer]